MKAAILTKQHRPLDLADIEPPAGLDFGQVRVRVHYSSVCGSQIGEIDGVKGPDPHLPHLLGHEGSGKVLEVGEGVTTVSPGDRVVLHWMRGSGHDAPLPTYAWGSAQVKAGSVTTFNEEAVVAENRVTRLANSVDIELAPLLGCAITTAAGVIANDAALRAGESIVVLGTGGVGLSVVQMAALSGAHPVIAVDVAPPKLALARDLGATRTLHGGPTEIAAAVTAELGDSGVDVVVDTTGTPRLIELAYELTSPQGRAILVGVPPVGGNASLHTLPLHFGKVLTGSHGGSARPDVDIPRLVRLVEAGKLDLAPLITNRFDLYEINQAIAAVRAGEVAGRALIRIAPE